MGRYSGVFFLWRDGMAEKGKAGVRHDEEAQERERERVPPTPPHYKIHVGEAGNEDRHYTQRDGGKGRARVGQWGDGLRGR